MQNMENSEPKDVFRYFNEITQIPHGSGDMEKISDYCMEFAKKHNLKAVRDEANNVIIYKPASKGYENSEPVILQGHLDMVCQKDEGIEIDFEKDGLDIYIDGGYIKAKGTTLGADNGIAVAIIMSILERDDIAHPPIEAVFSTDEEIGMVGAIALSMDNITAKRMINIDSEDPEVVTVSCAGGSDFKMTVPLEREKVSGKCIEITVKGLKGGHSGVEIDKGRVNANILLGRILGELRKSCEFSLISIDGGDKANAIPLYATAKIVTDDESIVRIAEEYADIVKEEISAREENFDLNIDVSNGEYDVINQPETDKIINLLLCAPNGVMEMSAEIDGLVETSLNLGIVKTDVDSLLLHFALRSNKKSALIYLEDRLSAFASAVDCKIETGGHYPPWEYNSKSELQEIYKEKYMEKFGTYPRIEAIHAGLECGVFASQIEGFDCISIGPRMYDIHTTKERLSITSTKEIYEIVSEVLKALK